MTEPVEADRCWSHCAICRGLGIPQGRGARWTVDVMSDESRDQRKRRLLEEAGDAA